MKLVILLLLAFALSFSAVVPGLAQGDPSSGQPPDSGDVVQSPDSPAPDDTSSDGSPDMSIPGASDAAANSDSPPDPAPDTQTPVNTDTTTPVATDTPTPEPTDAPAPTATPTVTPTSIAKVVPSDALARQLPFANPGEFGCDLFMDGSIQPPCGPVTFPARALIQFVNVDSPPVSVQVDNRKPEIVSSMSWDFVSIPGGIGPGTHKITATENVQGATRTFSLSITVSQAKSPHFLVLPRTVAPGSSGRVYLAGFKPNTPMDLGIYREQPNCNVFSGSSECYTLAHDLGMLTTAGDGTAASSFSIGANEQRTAYLAVIGGLQIDGQDPTSALQALGMPWFLVDNP